MVVRNGLAALKLGDQEEFSSFVALEHDWRLQYEWRTQYEWRRNTSGAYNTSDTSPYLQRKRVPFRVRLRRRASKVFARAKQGYAID